MGLLLAYVSCRLYDALCTLCRDQIQLPQRYYFSCGIAAPAPRTMQQRMTEQAFYILQRLYLYAVEPRIGVCGVYCLHCVQRANNLA